MPRPSNSSRFYHPKNILCGVHKGCYDRALNITFKVTLFASKMRLSKYVDKVTGRMTEELGIYILRFGSCFFRHGALTVSRAQTNSSTVDSSSSPSLQRWRGQGLGLSTLHIFPNTRILGQSDVEVATFGKISGPFLAHSSTFRY
jgi:hypothetical protein